MNMLNHEGGDFHPTHESYSLLIQTERDAVEQMISTIGQEAVDAMLTALGLDGQHAAIAEFIQNELDTERENISLIHQQGS